MFDTALELKKNAELLLAGIGKGKPHTELHGIALNVLMSSAELLKQIEINELTNNEPTKPKQLRIKGGLPPVLSDVHEIQKVEHRLKLWANRPHQINYRILKKWIELKDIQDMDKITEDDLANALIEDGLEGGYNTFYTNFAQMKTIALKNHGKVFSVENGLIEIWAPVIDAVLDFKSKVFAGKEQ